MTAAPVLRPAGGAVPQDWPRLAAHLAAHGHRLDRDPPPRQFAGGFGNLNYLIGLDGRPAVLRRPPPGPLPPGANDMARESRILSHLETAFPLAPRLLHFAADPHVFGAPFLIMEYRPGLVIGGNLPAEVAGRPDIGAEIADNLVRVLASLHAIDAEAIGLGGLGRPDGFLARTLAGWARRAELAWDGSPPGAVGALVSRIEAEGLTDVPPALLHNDYKLDNLILDPDSLTPVALIDWDLGTRGDPLWDLAVLLSYWAEPGDPPAMLALGQMPTHGHGFPGRDAVMRRYAEATGRDLSRFRAHRAIASFRLAVVFRQIFRRWRDTGIGEERCAGFDDLSLGLLEFAGAVAHGRFV